jgi:hypothetical protein
MDDAQQENALFGLVTGEVYGSGAARTRQLSMIEKPFAAVATLC